MGGAVSTASRLADVVRSAQSVRPGAVVPQLLRAAAPGVPVGSRFARARPVRGITAEVRSWRTVQVSFFRSRHAPARWLLVDTREARPVLAGAVVQMTWGVYAHQVHLWTIEIQEDSHN